MYILFKSAPVKIAIALGASLSLLAGTLVWNLERQLLKNKIQNTGNRLSIALDRRLAQTMNSRDHPQFLLQPATKSSQDSRLTRIVKKASQVIDLKHFDLYLYNLDSASWIIPRSLSKPTSTSPNRSPRREGRDFVFFYDGRRNISEIVVDPKQRLKINLNSVCESDLTFCVRDIKFGTYDTWQLLLSPQQHYGILEHWKVLATCLVGFLMTWILASYLSVSLRYTQQIEVLIQEREKQAKNLQKSLSDLQQAQMQLVQSEKMSSLGQLVAGIAHEINNPVTFIYGNLKYFREYSENLLELVNLYQNVYPHSDPVIENFSDEIELDFIQEDLPKILKSFQIGTERIQTIVLSLRNFSRHDESAIKAVDIHEGIESTLVILQNRLKEKSDRPAIKIEKNYDFIPPIECHASQLNQVFMNLLANAIDALEDALQIGQMQVDPIIKISTMMRSRNVRVCIADNGVGIEKSNLEKLYEPFFTTKPTGKGTGLGLAISHRIITQTHHGQFWCESALGEGTKFWIELPIGSELPAASPAVVQI